MSGFSLTRLPGSGGCEQMRRLPDVRKVLNMGYFYEARPVRDVFFYQRLDRKKGLPSQYADLSDPAVGFRDLWPVSGLFPGCFFRPDGDPPQISAESGVSLVLAFRRYEFVAGAGRLVRGGGPHCG